MRRYRFLNRTNLSCLFDSAPFNNVANFVRVDRATSRICEYVLSINKLIIPSISVLSKSMLWVVSPMAL
jgi:hypothetical protein